MVRKIQEITQSGSIGQHKNTNTTTIIPNKNKNNYDSSKFDSIFKNKIKRKTKYELNNK